MENLEAIFREEAFDLINDLEKSLFNLEANPTDKSLIERVFRVMHTLKGNCNMFGYEGMGEFTHSLENIYDLVREDKLPLNRDILDVSLMSLDHLKALINDSKIADPHNQAMHQDLTGKIQGIINQESDPEEKEKPEAKSDLDISNGNVHTYYILFRPNDSILKNGTNPLYLLDELNALGNCKITPHTIDIPEMDQLDPTTCYIFWDIYLATDKNMQSIYDVFIFVEKECQLEVHKVVEGNLLDKKEFVDKVDEELSFKEDINVNELKDFAQSLFKIVKGQRTSQSQNQPDKKDSLVSSIRVSSEKLDDLMNLVSELVTTQASLSLIADNSESPELLAIAENIEKISRRLRDNTFSICLIPIENLITRFQRLVRDLSQELNKKIEFVTEGADTELDKSIIDSLADPLLHILRNSIDHGIEDAETRQKQGKPEKGRILLKAFYSGTHVMIQIKDDGKGIDPEKIKSKAISKGLIAPDAILSEREVFDLLFLPGFSTAQQVTEVSGRGVGMDVVKRKISDIRGEVNIDSKINEGTSITIKLPLTLSIIDGLLVKIYDTFFVIPLSAVDKCYEIEHIEIAQSFNNLLVLDGKQVPFINLRDEFNITFNPPNIQQVVMVDYDGDKVGLSVDEIIGEYQAVLKPLGRLYKDVEIVSGATILGDGTIALVLDTNRIVKSFSELITKTEEVK
ncbi:MAG: chemotaxis protein CheA [Candidatus Cyclobacteriaceae bacterium M3_2C_046]